MPIDPQRRAALALPDPATPIAAAALLPLTSAQWSDPEIVVARFLLVQANHSTSDDPFVFAARRAAYTSPTLARQLELTAAGAAPLARLRAADLLDGIIDQRVVDFLAWAVQRHTVAVSVLKTGHSQYVAGTSRVSNHWMGRGVYIYAVDGEIVSRASTASRTLAIEAADLVPPARPRESGVPWPDLTNRPGVFSDGAHQDHLHFGWSE